MSIKTLVFDEFEPAIQYLESLALSSDDYVFRGHNQSDYRLLSTLARHHLRERELAPFTLELILKQFQAGLARIGQFPFAAGNRQDWLEFARHCGVPTPCIDFTYSPYIALFFAFNGVESVPPSKTGKEYVAVLCLDVEMMAHSWLRTYGGGFNDDKYWFFRGQDDSFFESDFPQSLKFLHAPSTTNRNMQRQLGALVYDLVPWETTQHMDLQDFFEKTSESHDWLPKYTPKVEGHILTKVIVNKNCARLAFQRLLLMGLTGATLFGDASGVAMDVLNSRHYASWPMELRGVGFKKE